jgi:hypothetical protein
LLPILVTLDDENDSRHGITCQAADSGT